MLGGHPRKGFVRWANARVGWGGGGVPLHVFLLFEACQFSVGSFLLCSFGGWAGGWVESGHPWGGRTSPVASRRAARGGAGGVPGPHAVGVPDVVCASAGEGGLPPITAQSPGAGRPPALPGPGRVHLWWPRCAFVCLTSGAVAAGRRRCRVVAFGWRGFRRVKARPFLCFVTLACRSALGSLGIRTSPLQWAAAAGALRLCSSPARGQR